MFMVEDVAMVISVTVVIDDTNVSLVIVVILTTCKANVQFIKVPGIQNILC